MPRSLGSTFRSAVVLLPVLLYTTTTDASEYAMLGSCMPSTDLSIPKPSTSQSSDPEWFQKLREQMLNRELPPLYDKPSKRHEDVLAATLSAYLPAGFETTFRSIPSRNGFTPSHTIGNHLAFFNPTVPTNELLSDGTDSLQSPGDPFVRRMWTGGSIKVHPPAYFQPSFENGWGLNFSHLCIERIKEVSLRGQGDSEKIFVTIERRIASIPSLESSRAASKYEGPGGVSGFFQEQARKREESWGDAYLIEERNLVFMRERNEAELEAIKAGQVAPTKYLKAPGQPDFSHTTVPTRSLLFRFSALTFNAHAIHLDRDYCRTVEGHRNLLVHGPLTLMLMLKFISSHLRKLDGPRRFVESIEYRNLAPLYCDEELRLCAREREGLVIEGKDSMFDVWIEGPTGGVAVKGTVITGSRVTPAITRAKARPSLITDDHGKLFRSMDSAPLPDPDLPVVPNNAVLRKIWFTDKQKVSKTEDILPSSPQSVRFITPNTPRVRKTGKSLEFLNSRARAPLPWR
ncbi:hypothetical protein DM02DRAFT_670335 [Periconia macrospinosa]|uniref:Thioesterase/thiol ester dehydrase-isomerase n=1 Tax=Periconia macrospinosa TaxID=97972 RepID=A0A2V1DWM7_9PLEO|nr:hypothetical protein DM02DRAFT_670335 [Periconia macrospinosa]